MRPILATLILLSIWSVISCTKTNNISTTVHDTTTLIHYDTTIVRDTTVKKDTVWEKTPKNPIVGLWIGTYHNNGDPAVDTFYYQFDIQANGVIITSAIGATNNSDATAGTWHLSGTAFTANTSLLTNTTPVLQQSITAVYDSTAGTLNGQWTYTVGTGPNGSFTLNRVP